MPLPEHNLERELALVSLAMDLRQHPEKAFILALNYYEDRMNLSDDGNHENWRYSNRSIG